jgi:hypothetical protein
VLFTVFDKGNGVIDVIVSNGLQYAVNVFLLWSYGGENGQSTQRLAFNKAATLVARLPAGFDGTLEVIARRA